MDQQQKNLKRYAELKAIEKATKTEIAELAPQIKDFIAGQQVDKLPTNLGIFSITSVQVWKYSPAVEVAEEEVEKLKEQEKADGTAVADVRQDLKFTPAKPQKE